MAVCTLLILDANFKLLLVIPPLVLSLHLGYSTRIRSRTEQQAWQRLARTTDALNVVDLDTVLEATGIERTQLDRVAEMLAASERTIACWAMGLTQHRHAVAMIAGTAQNTPHDFLFTKSLVEARSCPAVERG